MESCENIYHKTWYKESLSAHQRTLICCYYTLYKPIIMQEVTKIHALVFEPTVLPGPCSLNHSSVFIINVLL